MKRGEAGLRDTDSRTMSCYICLEEGGEQVNGCACRGSVAVHRPCLLEWLKTAENPFRCSVCKSDFAGSFLSGFLSAEQILFHPTVEEEESEGEMWEFHGIPVFESDSQLVFATPEHMSIYFQTLKREFLSLKKESRRRVSMPNERRAHARGRTTSHAVLARGNRSFRK